MWRFGVTLVVQRTLKFSSFFSSGDFSVVRARVLVISRARKSPESHTLVIHEGPFRLVKPSEQTVPYSLGLDFLLTTAAVGTLISSSITLIMTQS